MPFDLVKSQPPEPIAAQPPRSALIDLTTHSPAQTLDHARQLLLEYGRFVQSHYEIAHFCLANLEQEAAGLPSSYLRQSGGAILAVALADPHSGQIQSIPLGFAAWRSLPNLPSAWEIKRLWLRPEARGFGLGRQLVQAIVDRAPAAQISKLVLDTAPAAMPAAHRLYQQMGFQECPPYNGPRLPGIEYLVKFL